MILEYLIGFLFLGTAILAFLIYKHLITVAQIKADLLLMKSYLTNEKSDPQVKPNAAPQQNTQV
jgi:hypothetical protein